MYYHKIVISQLKFLYPLKTLAFPAFSPLRFGPFPSFFPLREEMRETFFRPSLQPYPAALRKFAWPLWWRGRKCSSWYLHQNVPVTPAHPWVLPRGREGWSYMYASTDGSENHPYFSCKNSPRNRCCYTGYYMANQHSGPNSIQAKT